MHWRHYVELSTDTPQLIHNIPPDYSLDHHQKTHYLVIKTQKNPTSWVFCYNLTNSE